MTTTSECTATAVPVNPQNKLAFERTRVAYDRTMMAWIRTATSLISFGFAVYKFFQIELGLNSAQPNLFIEARRFSLLMVVAGILALLLGAADHWRNMRSLRALDTTLPRSLSGLLTACILALGVLTLLAVIFRK
jgi:putative membrane protein